jgi:ketosteroid isomerase-like protein
MTDRDATATQILALERAALDRWGKGDPGGYLDLSAAGVTYFDPLVAIRVDGVAALADYYRPVTGTIAVDRYVMLNPHVVTAGDMALLTFNLVNYNRRTADEETVTSRWNCTEVYHRIDERWRIVHSHWTFTTPTLQAEPR